jgi:nicotinate phosphoribosyltransferase
MRYGIPISGTMAHSFVMGFDSELEAFRAYGRAFPKKTVLLVDTYDIEQGIKNAIIVAKEMEARGERLSGIRIDSGDLAHFSRMAHNLFNEQGLGYVKVVLSNDLDEKKIIEIAKKGGWFDVLGVGTMVSTSNDAPSLGGVYKLSEQETEEGVMRPTIKISEGKTTFPGLKQVYRFFARDGRSYMDEICLASERRGTGVPLLEKVMEGGRVIVDMPTLEEIRAHCASERNRLPDSIRSMDSESYEVQFSPRILALQTKLVREAEHARLPETKNARKIKG